MYCAQADEARFADLLPSVDVVWHVLKPISAAMIHSASCLRLIQKIGVGVNTIALDAARERGIAVCNMPGANARSVAEMALALMLAALRRLPALEQATRSGAWVLDASLQDTLGEIGGRTVGLVGAGNVPRLLAPWLTAMGATVLYTSRDAKPDFPGTWRTLDSLLAASDIVSLHVPATAQTQHLIDATALARMKPGALLVNTARGELVDEQALLDALQRVRLAGAALDVFAQEPLPASHPLLAHPRVVATPHVAWLTGEMFERSLAIALENVRRLAAGEALLHRVA